MKQKKLDEIVNVSLKIVCSNLVNKYGFSESSAKKIMKSKKLKRKIKKFLKENNQYVEYVD